ncbi:FG-GAP-like repeat-containing protein [Aestuariimicrobium sp. T2.26MG-19.2B]|uniref:FG-GAP-like repeat-containing protein n=1 Tax=Aestuariimicrobium sp. T2.26MG-19.2B TaxID=3040679 RepID=UPI00254230CE|nr:FG-GAP-like repeat-containing protein [Aestuariimicrobium sp. T2.26MG-19.2B]
MRPSPQSAGPSPDPTPRVRWSPPTAVRISVLALATTLTAAGLFGGTAHAETTAELGPALAPPTAVAPATTSTGVKPAADALTSEALARLNSYRSQFGVPAVTENSTWSQAAVAHSNYMALNGVVTNAEDPALPGYTDAGNVAAQNSHVALGYTTPTSFVDAWAASPFHLITMLSGRLTTSAYGQATQSGRTAATLNVLQGRTGAEPTSGWPRTWPKGTTTMLEMSDGSYPDPAAGCGAPVGSWYGTANLIDYGPSATVTSATATLVEDGSNVPVCVRTASSYSNPTARALMAGKVLVIPMRPLTLNRGYTGTVTTASGTHVYRFDTGNPASGVTGDHNGDGLADILAVRGDGDLYFYQTKPGPSVAPGVVVGRGWGPWDWMAVVPDLNGDSRTELIGRQHDTGKLFLFFGLGRGLWSSAMEIGHGFDGLSLLTVVNDITGDGLPELLGRTSDGSLYRYSFTAGGKYLNNTRKIGRGWGGIATTFSPGDFSGDGTPDLLAVTQSGLLIRYAFSGGSFSTANVVGRGWQPTDKLWSPGDIDGNGTADLLSVRNGGQLYFYANRVGTWSVGKAIGSGWDSMRLLT